MVEEDPLVTECRQRMGHLVSGKWRLDALIGVGGMAAVYAATHRNGAVAAIKMLHSAIATNAEARTRFLREAYIANKVGHEGTVKVIDDGVDDSGLAYLVMELLTGKTAEALADDNGGFLSIAQTLDIAEQTLQVLEAAHPKNIVHRDLKPENLFVTEQGQVKVLDFGVARLREDNMSRTQTGLVMGTPSFMAPEQAMGRWSEVDGRTDLWAMGATIFTLLTGQPVHEAETPGEMQVAAATRHARSLARVLSGAPFPLVRLVDRSLAYERENRFPDATTFLTELRKVREALAGEEDRLVRPAAGPEADMPPTVYGEEAPEDTKKQEVDAFFESFDPTRCSEKDLTNLAKVFTLVERMLAAKKQYGKQHPETLRRTNEAFRETASALLECDIALGWQVNAYSFYVGDTAVWEPDEPWNRVPYQLFSDGIRMMGLSQGIDEDEFNEWLRIITLDPATEISPEDDLVTMLFEATFEHVFHQAIDSFAEGNQEERANFERQRQEIVQAAKELEGTDIAEAWQAGHGARDAGSNADDTNREVVHFISQSLPMDSEAAARAANLDLDEREVEQAAVALDIDASTRALLAARLEIDVGATSERFVVSAAHAYVASVHMGRPAAVAGPLRTAVDGLAEDAPIKAIEMVLTMREAVEVEGDAEETERMRAAITTDLLSDSTLKVILSKVPTEEDPDYKAYAEGLSEILGCLQSRHFELLLECLLEIKEKKVRRTVLEGVARMSEAQESKMAALFERADVDLALDLVRVLARLETKAAKEAIAQAAQSPHALVRIEALGYVEGVSSAHLRRELRKLVEDKNPKVRLQALQAMERHSVSVAGPFLVLRVQSGDFNRLPYEERKQALKTLCTLKPKRAEEVCMKLLGAGKLLRSGRSEQTRELAAGFLAEVASTNPALYLLEEVSKSNWWSASSRVREAASSALTRLEQRAGEAREMAEKRREATKATRMRAKTAAGAARPAGGAARPKPAAASPAAATAGQAPGSPQKAKG